MTVDGLSSRWTVVGHMAVMYLPDHFTVRDPYPKQTFGFLVLRFFACIPVLV